MYPKLAALFIPYFIAMFSVFSINAVKHLNLGIDFVTSRLSFDSVIERSTTDFISLDVSLEVFLCLAQSELRVSDNEQYSPARALPLRLAARQTCVIQQSDQGREIQQENAHSSEGFLMTSHHSPC